MKPKVLVTRELPQEGMTYLRRYCQVEANPYDRAMTREEMLAAVRDKEGLLCLLSDTVDEELLEAAPRLKVVSNYAVGYNNIDVAAATRRGIMVTNTPGVLTEATADLAWALLMAVARRVVEGDRFTRAGHFKGWAPLLLLGSDIFGATLGLVGMGRIGRAMARRARGFSMRVLYYNHTRMALREEEELGVSYASKEEVLRQADYVSLHVPYTPHTHHLIGRRELELMKPTAYLINTARGPVVDEVALVEALRHGRLAGAGLDVYENEPELTPGLAELDNVVLAPHLGSATTTARTRMALMATENLVAALRGGTPPNLVNP